MPLFSNKLHQEFKKYKNVSVHYKHIGSFCSRSKNTSTVIISWNKDLFCSGMVNKDCPAMDHGSNIMLTDIILVSL